MVDKTFTGCIVNNLQILIFMTSVVTCGTLCVQVTVRGNFQNTTERCVFNGISVDIICMALNHIRTPRGVLQNNTSIHRFLLYDFYIVFFCIGCFICIKIYSPYRKGIP